MNILLDLFLTFAKIGTFTFGGGYAMIAMMENICVEKKKWITHDEMMDVTVIAESTPGPIAINCATFTGYEQAGLKGAAVATLGMVLPPFLIIYLISIFLDGFLTMPLIAAALQGIKIAVGLGSLQNVVPNGKALLITVVLAGVMLGYKHFQKKKLSTIALIMLSAVVGIAASVCP